MNAKEVISNVKEHKLDVVRLLFTDILGRLKGVNVTTSELDRAVEEGIAFDGSSIEGFVRIEESDLILKPDPDSFKIFPFETGGLRSGFFFCDVTAPDGQPLPNDPRQVLRKMLHKASAMGYQNFKVGPELEFFYFPDETNATPPDSAGYFDIMPMDAGSHARDRTLAILGDMGITMEADHHEVAEGQHEINFKYADALECADNTVTFKWVVKSIAKKHKLHATFMPKPIFGINGSGMHANQSLFNLDGTNAFADENDERQLSEIAYQYIAGIIKNARGFAAITNPLVNSYKRLVPGYEAPVYVAWSASNRSALVRIPASRGVGTRVEVRCPDPTCNPYLAFAMMLNSGLDGIKNKLTPPKPTDINIFDMTAQEKDEAGIASMPGSLREALDCLSENPITKDTLGDHIFEKYMFNKETEWDNFRISVTDWEINNYLNLY